MSAKSFVLGIGCQKGGTSWLHDYLDNHHQTDMGFQKEYHVFDALYVQGCDAVYHRILRIAREGLNNDKFLSSEKGKNILKRLDFYRDVSNYFDYFDYLALRVDAVKVVGDITPSYSALPVRAFTQIKEHLAVRGFTPRIVFLTRDPVERCWSAARMARRDAQARNPGGSPGLSESEEVAQYFLTGRCEVRTRYDHTHKRVCSVFDDDNVLSFLYEELFSDEALSEITRFLGIEFMPGDFDNKVNTSEKFSELDEDLKCRIANHYSDVYRWAERQFGRERILKAWPNAHYVIG
ncbi:MAG: sulfotransferase domain-containing protein [Pseudomonadota bacterium]